jgi:hypothetical protein
MDDLHTKVALRIFTKLVHSTSNREDMVKVAEKAMLAADVFCDANTIKHSTPGSLSAAHIPEGSPNVRDVLDQMRKSSCTPQVVEKPFPNSWPVSWSDVPTPAQIREEVKQVSQRDDDPVHEVEEDPFALDPAFIDELRKELTNDG